METTADASPDDATDSGPRSRASERTCIVTRQALPPEALIRFVLAPDGSVAADLGRKLPGRGAWVTARRDIVAQAEAKRLFAKAFKHEVREEPGLADRVEAQLRRRALGSLGLAAKAGLIAAGFAKVEAALGRGDVAALIEASDGADDGGRKLAAVAARQRAGNSAVPTVSMFSSAELGLALGRANVIHAALLAGPAGGGFLARAQGLAVFGEPA